MDVGLNDVGQFRTGKTSGEQRAVGRMANGEWGVGSGEWGVGGGEWWEAASSERRAVENSEWRMANGGKRRGWWPGWGAVLLSKWSAGL